MDRAIAAAPLVLLAVTAAAVYRTLFRAISDPDAFWHLRLGSYLLSTGEFRGPEPWTSLATRPLVLHEWGPEVVYAWVFDLAGWSGLAWLQAIEAVVLLVVLYYCTRRFSPPLLAAIITVVGFGGAFGSLALRPQIVSFALVAIVTTTWLRTADDGRPRWWLIPLTWLWACCHGMWFVGVAIGFAAVLGMILDKRISFRGATRLALVPVLSVGAAALTPVGPSLLWTAVKMRAYTQYVGEWSAPALFTPQSILTLALALTIALAWWRATEPARWTEIGLWLAGVTFALLYTRTIAVGAMILAVLAAAALARHPRVGTGTTPSSRTEMVVLSTVVALLAGLGPLTLAADADRPSAVPSGMNEALAEMPAGTVVYNEYVLGGWLLWEHPELDPVIDGRADVYDIEHFARVADSYELSPGWDTTVRGSRASVAVLYSSSPLAHALVDQLGWTETSFDAGYVLLLPPDRHLDA